jgi:F-type H+-transporting ATPase subunit a
MEHLDAGSTATWNLLGFMGIEHELLKVNSATLYNTWAVLALILILSLIARFSLSNKRSIIRFITLQGIKQLADLFTQSVGMFLPVHFYFIATIFVFILLSNWLSIIPSLGEPTSDLNTTLALGLISFFYKEKVTIQMHGWKAYFKEFFEPFFIMFPLNVIGHFSKIISLSFRLFGNIFGGAIITTMYASARSMSVIFEILGLLSSFNFIVIGFFIFFEGLIQAFVFTMLTLTYLGNALSIEGEE